MRKHIDTFAINTKVPSEYSRRGRAVDPGQFKSLEWQHFAMVLSIPVCEIVLADQK